MTLRRRVNFRSLPFALACNPGGGGAVGTPRSRDAHLSARARAPSRWRSHRQRRPWPVADAGASTGCTMLAERRRDLTNRPATLDHVRHDERAQQERWSHVEAGTYMPSRTNAHSARNGRGSDRPRCSRGCRRDRTPRSVARDNASSCSVTMTSVGREARRRCTHVGPTASMSDWACGPRTPVGAVLPRAPARTCADALARAVTIATRLRAITRLDSPGCRGGLVGRACCTMAIRRRSGVLGLDHRREALRWIVTVANPRGNFCSSADVAGRDPRSAVASAAL